MLSRLHPMSLLLLLLLLVGLVCASSRVGDRSRRQAIACEPGDAACKRCSNQCRSISVSYLPECCEAYNACCNVYLSSCKQCGKHKKEDPFFPEYCCASFTACCEDITTIDVALIAPTTKVRTQTPRPQQPVLAPPVPEKPTTPLTSDIPSFQPPPDFPEVSPQTEPRSHTPQQNKRQQRPRAQQAQRPVRRRGHVSSRGRVFE